MPKHLIFRKDTIRNETSELIEVQEFDKSDITSCSVFLMGYFVALIQTFTTYCMWHSKVCLINGFLIIVQYFKMPALSRAADSQKIKKEKTKVEKIFDRKWNDVTHKMKENMKKRDREISEA